MAVARRATPTTPTSCASTSTRSPAPDFADAVAAAFELREVLAEAGLTAFVKTSGNRGLHVFAPITPDARVPRRAPRRDRGRPRARAADAGPRDDRVVEGGARRADLRRLQPGRPRPHDRRRLQPAGARARRRVHAGLVGGAGGRRPARLHDPDRARSACADGRRPVGGDAATAAARSRRCWAGGSATSRTGSASCRSRPTTRRCRASRRACSPAERRTGRSARASAAASAASARGRVARLASGRACQVRTSARSYATAPRAASKVHERGVAVGAPALELHGVPEPRRPPSGRTHLEHPLRAQADERDVLATDENRLRSRLAA